MAVSKNLVWIASYPKSGNTWFRAFLSAYLNESSELQLNSLTADALFSSREIFDLLSDIDSSYLYEEEVKDLIPDVYTAFSEESEKLLFIKVHDAYTLNRNGVPIIPGEVSQAVIYIIRNPLDIVSSFAHHMGSSTDHAIRTMNRSNATLASQKGELNTNSQLRQLLLNWSEHVSSWTTQSEIPVLVLRYEDMLQNARRVFTSAIEYLGLPLNASKIEYAIGETAFSKLKEKEQAHGFIEKLPASSSFFRSGTKENWKHELTQAEVQKMIQVHAPMMQQYGYL